MAEASTVKTAALKSGLGMGHPSLGAKIGRAWILPRELPTAGNLLGTPYRFRPSAKGAISPSASRIPITRRFGTDGPTMRYNPNYFQEQPAKPFGWPQS